MRSARGGFTLIEALVAFVVLASLLVVMDRLVVDNRASASTVATHFRRQLAAQSILSEFLARRDFKVTTYRGSTLGLSWAAKVTRLSAITTKAGWIPCRVDIMIGDEPAVQHIETVRLVPGATE